MLKLDHVNYQIGNKTIFSNANAQLLDHEITCLIGPNGVGKSTLFNLITQNIKPQSGEITGVPERIALLAQKNELYEPLTVHELLTIQKNDLDAEVLTLLQLTDLLESPINVLSGGQRQLVWLGYVLHQDPELLLLDEPTTYLDLKYQQIFLNTLTVLQKERQFTVLMILHDLTQAFNYSQNIWLVNQQHQLITGPSESLLDANLLSTEFKVPLQIIETNQHPLIIPALS